MTKDDKEKPESEEEGIPDETDLSELEIIQENYKKKSD